MAQKPSTIMRKIRQFRNIIIKDIPVKKILLYGSYAKGVATKDSDIDLLVVVKRQPKLSKHYIATKLAKYALEVAPEIEPKCVFWDEYRKPQKASILEEIIKTSKVVED